MNLRKINNIIKKIKRIEYLTILKSIMFILLILIIISISLTEVTYSLSIRYVNFNNPEFILLNYNKTEYSTTTNFSLTSNLTQYNKSKTKNIFFNSNYTNSNKTQTKIILQYLIDNKNKKFKLNEINLTNFFMNNNSYKNNTNNKTDTNNSNKSEIKKRDKDIEKQNYILIIDKNLLEKIKNKEIKINPIIHSIYITSNGKITSYGLNNQGENFSLNYKYLYLTQNSTYVYSTKNYTIMYIYKKFNNISSIKIFTNLNNKTNNNYNNQSNYSNITDNSSNYDNKNNKSTKNYKVKFNIISNIFYRDKINFSFVAKKLNLTNNISEDLTNISIEYWITDLWNKTVKDKLETKNTNKKIFSPKKRIGIYFINSILKYKSKNYYIKKRVVCYKTGGFNRDNSSEINNNGLTKNKSTIIIQQKDNNLGIKIYKGNTRKRVITIYINNNLLTKLYLKKYEVITLIYNLKFLEGMLQQIDKNYNNTYRYKKLSNNTLGNYLNEFEDDTSNLEYSNNNLNNYYLDNKKILNLTIIGLGINKSYIIVVENNKNYYKDNKNYNISSSNKSTTYNKNSNIINNIITNNQNKKVKNGKFFITKINLTKNNLSFILHNNYLGNLSCYILQKKTKISNTFNIYFINKTIGNTTTNISNMNNRSNYVINQNIIRIKLNVNKTKLNIIIKKNNLTNKNKILTKILCKIKLKGKKYYKYTSNYINITRDISTNNKSRYKINENNYSNYKLKTSSNIKTLKMNELFSLIENPVLNNTTLKTNNKNKIIKNKTQESHSELLFSKRKSVFNILKDIILITLCLLSIFLIIKY